MSKPIGEFICPLCGIQQFDDTTGITIYYPEGIRKPRAKVLCKNCGKESICEVEWKDAMVFDFQGASVQGFSFSRGPKITEPEIEAFVVDIEDEIERFLDAAEQDS